MSTHKQLILIERERPCLDLKDAPRSLGDFSSLSYSPHANQSLRAFVESHSTSEPGHSVNPQPENLTAGKNTHVYDAHTYHTKVPPEAIKHLIEHYTSPGELVLDPFCGSGMTGVAALSCGRKPILIDLAPAATFIAMNFITPVDALKYQGSIDEILAATDDEEIRLFGTNCRACDRIVPMEYMVWSYGLICEFCREEFVLWDVARDERDNVRESKIRAEFDCPHCSKHLQKRKLLRTQLYPVEVGYRCCQSGLQETKAMPNEHDLRTIRASEEAGINQWHPTAKLPEGVNTRQAIAHGMESVDAFYTRRSLRAMAVLWDVARRWRDEEISLKLMFTVTSLYQRVTRLSEFRFWGGSGNIANYNVPMIFNEQNVFKVFNRKAKTIRNYLATCVQTPRASFCVSTQSAMDLSSIPDGSIDYIFTDPPFGSNINYSEMNFLWEAWLGVFTDPAEEAIINRAQRKTIHHYQELMTKAVAEMRRVLKPDRWLTLVFHNSSSAVWSVIQDAVSSSGFEIEKTQMLDKRHGTFKQFVSENAVGYDLILHCRKRASGIAARSHKRTGSLSSIRRFIKLRLKETPDEFIVRYLHVRRRSEIDSRKLFSMWLKEKMESGETVEVDYDQFRNSVAQVVREEFPELEAGGWTGE
jgi:DNA modification methylase